MKSISKQINFYSQKRDFPKESAKKLEFDLPRWNNYQQRFIIAPKRICTEIAEEVFAKELENIFKKNGYETVLSSHGFFHSFKPERFALNIQVSTWIPEYHLQEDSKTRPGFMSGFFNLKAPIFKEIPLRAEGIRGKVFPNKINYFKNPERILNCLKNAGYDAHYTIVEEKPKKTKIKDEDDTNEDGNGLRRSLNNYGGAGDLLRGFGF